MHGNKAKLRHPTLALLRCKANFQIFELGLIAVQIELFQFMSLALLRYKAKFQIFELSLIAVQIELLQFMSLA